MSLLFPNNSAHPRFADIILPLSLPQALTYGIPIELQEKVSMGMRVEVMLGTNKSYAGIVVKLHQNKPENYQVKPIKNIIDETPILQQEQLAFWEWICSYYMCNPGDVMQAALPAHLKLVGETSILWLEGNEDLYWTPPTQQVVDILISKKELSLSVLKSITGSSNFISVLQELLEQEAVSIEDGLTPTYQSKKEKFVFINEHYEQHEPALIKLFDDLAKAPKQLALLMCFLELKTKHEFVSHKAILERAKCTSAQLNSLVQKSVFYVEEKSVDRLIYKSTEEMKSIVFSAAQKIAFQQLSEQLLNKNVVLLEGITGSGKTLLYIHKIKEIIESGKQALLVLPEIGLTTQLVQRLRAYFGAELGVYHSKFSHNERVEIWEKVKNQQYKIIVGPRSTLWLPFQQLGLIVVDEEHDTSLKQEKTPRFHARDAAIYLASIFKAKVILGSATPSVETLYNSQQGKFGYVQLSERYLGVDLPEINIVNAKSLELVRKDNIKLLTPELIDAIKNTLQQKKQVILFQNRRGYAPFQICVVCGWVPHCQQCAVSLTYHKSTDKLHCHYCGTQALPMHVCPSCGSHHLQSKSFGTERIEEEVKQVFPTAHVARMDVDSMKGKKSMTHLLTQMDNHEIDILVGTQMVVKGLDFTSVSLVGILSADSLFSYPDFRVNERAFQLMEQVSGRAGRKDGKGIVFIQAYNLEHPVLTWVQKHDLKACYQHELQYRQLFGYPPFSRLIKVIFKSTEEQLLSKAASLFAEVFQQNEQIVVQGPVPALVSKIRNEFIYELWIKCPRNTEIIETTKKQLLLQKQTISKTKGMNKISIIFDVDPY